MNLLKHDNVHVDLPGKRRIRNLEDEYEKLWQMYGDLEEERDRLQEAGIAVINGAGRHERGWIITDAAMQAIRRATLQEDRDD